MQPCVLIVANCVAADNCRHCESWNSSQCRC